MGWAGLDELDQFDTGKDAAMISYRKLSPNSKSVDARPAASA
jgi:hypothetical protein